MKKNSGDLKSKVKKNALSSQDSVDAASVTDGEQHFTEARFWRKLANYAQQSGKDVVEVALKLFYAWKDPDTPQSAKAVIVGALVYFIVPTDAVFDLLPGGYVDDWGALLGALWTVAKHVKPLHAEKAKQKLSDWFEPEIDETNVDEQGNSE